MYNVHTYRNIIVGWQIISDICTSAFLVIMQFSHYQARMVACSLISMIVD